MTEPLGTDSFPYFGEEHAMLRSTIRRFIADRVAPFADAWEKQGFVPRETLREMGALGLFGMRYAPEYGGAGLDTLANAALGGVRVPRAGAPRHALPPPLSLRHAGAARALDAGYPRRPPHHRRGHDG